MLKEIVHVGITVSDIDRSIEFYRDILGLEYEGRLIMEGPETDALFKEENIKVHVAYLNGDPKKISPSVELLMFENREIQHRKCDLFQTSISEICFAVDDITAFHRHLEEQGIMTFSLPQDFDFTKNGFGKSKAIYFKDPDGIILEAMEYLEK
ncbi:MAG: VOC family protein [Tissierellia bacterium]|nr:VOC family protein [Tissierellia bacterium]